MLYGGGCYTVEDAVDIGVDSAGAAGARAPPIIEMVGHCPTNKSRGEFLKISKTSSETETKNLNTIRNSIMKTKIIYIFNVFKSSRLQYEKNFQVSKTETD